MYIIYRDLIGPPRRPDLPRDVQVQMDEARRIERELERELRLQRSRLRSRRLDRLKAAIARSLGL